jgi:ribosomal protein S18 acetylase RimI-like enzyme
MPLSDNPALIRPARATDAAALGRLGALLVRTHHDFDTLRFVAATAGTEQGYGSFLRSQLRESNIVVLVAEREGAVIGYAYMGMEGNDYMALRGPAGVLYDLIVEPDHRGQGVGKLLLDAALEALQERGARQIVLQTAEANAIAQRFFARAGFRRTFIEMTRDIEDTSIS